MNIEQIDLFKVLHALKYKLDDQSRVNVRGEIQQLEKKLRSGRIYNDELILLNVLNQRVNSKVSLINARITRDQNRRRLSRVIKDTHFKGIDIVKLRRFIAANEFKTPEFSWYCIEDEIADRFFERYLKNT